MADIIDTAADVEEIQRNASISAHRINHNAVSATRCIKCGDQISDKRREAVKGCTMCADCQQIAELKRKQRGM